MSCYGVVSSLFHRVTDPPYLVFTINRIASSDFPNRAARDSSRSIVTPVRSTLSVRTISGHVAGVATDTTDDVGGEIALLRAVILAVTDLTTYRMISRVSICKVRGVSYNSGKLGSRRHVGCRSRRRAHGAGSASIRFDPRGLKQP